MSDPSPLPPARCDTTQRLNVIGAAFALGIPRDYGRRHRLRVVREPAALSSIGEDIHGRHQWLAPRAARAWLRMRRAAATDGIDLQVVSAFRSASYQLVIIERKLERGLAIGEILRVSAAPGFSEHHSGRALDINTPGYAALEEEFETSPAFAWLQREAARFGFALSYPRGNPHGIAYEPWHWCWHRR
jgi:zinc D-Ala-D-Ala carboxypeptidase